MASLRKRNGKWQAQVRRTGHLPRSRTFLSRADAVLWIRQTESELDRAGITYDPGSLDRLTAADIIERYKREVTPSKRGLVSENKRLEVFLRQPWTKLPLSRLSPIAFNEYRERRLKEVSGATVRRELGLLQSVFELARREWDVGLVFNPVARVRKPKSAAGRERRLKPGEVDDLLTAAAEGRNDWLAPAILLAIETGMRRGEMLNVRLRDVDASRALLSIPQTKTDTPRTIPLTAKAAAILASLAEGLEEADSRLIPASANAFRLAWERCKRRAGVERRSLRTLRFHDLRHEAVSRFFELGLSVPEVALISGHRDPRMLFRYTHLRPEDVGRKLSSAMERVAS